MQEETGKKSACERKGAMRKQAKRTTTLLLLSSVTAGSLLAVTGVGVGLLAAV